MLPPKPSPPVQPKNYITVPIKKPIFYWGTFLGGLLLSIIPLFSWWGFTHFHNENRWLQLFFVCLGLYGAFVAGRRFISAFGRVTINIPKLKDHDALREEVAAFNYQYWQYIADQAEYEEAVEELEVLKAREEQLQKEAVQKAAEEAQRMLERNAERRLQEEREKAAEAERKALHVQIERSRRLQNMEGNFKVNWKEFEDWMQRKGIDKLYHFTDHSNIDSIIKHGGLFSWDYCYKQGITINCQGGNATSMRLDSEKGLENYVRLSFDKYTPMYSKVKLSRRLPNPVILEIDPLVIFQKTTLFSKGNATATGVIATPSLKVFKEILLNRTNYKRRDFTDLLVKLGMVAEGTSAPEPSEEELIKMPGCEEQSEVLVYECVPLSYIPNIHSFT